MKFGGFFAAEGIRRAAWIEPGVPESFSGIDIADACNPGLIQEKLFQWATGSGEALIKKRRGELRRERVGAERAQGRASGKRWPVVHASKMALIGEA
jgi:hypothetical protein